MIKGDADIPKPNIPPTNIAWSTFSTIGLPSIKFWVICVRPSATDSETVDNGIKPASCLKKAFIAWPFFNICSLPILLISELPLLSIGTVVILSNTASAKPYPVAAAKSIQSLRSLPL